MFMATSILDGEYIVLSKLDLRVLIALLKGPMSKYEIGRQCESDGRKDVRISNNPLYSSIKSLENMGLVGRMESVSSKTGFLFKITDTGRMILSWEEDNMKHQMKLIKERR